MTIRAVRLRTDERTGQQVVSGDPEEWVLCGFVRVDRFRAEGAAISYTYLLWFSTALAAICLGIPLVKLRGLGPRERFSAHDGVWVCVTTFAAAGLLTVIAMGRLRVPVRLIGRFFRTTCDSRSSITTVSSSSIPTAPAACRRASSRS